MRGQPYLCDVNSMCLRACLQVKFLAERLGKILTHVTCKAYLAVNADRLPKYNQHRVIADGHSGTPFESPADEVRVKIAQCTSRRNRGAG